MNRPIDTLFYQWVITEEDKKIPTILEDVSEMEDAEKFDALLSTYAGCVADLIEAEVSHRFMVDEAIDTANADPELAEENQELIAQAIMEMDEIVESEATVEAAKNALDLLHTSMVRVVARGV
jgi:hypothetical protein